MTYMFDDLFRTLKYKSKGEEVVEKFDSITTEFLLDMLNKCHWDPMDYDNSEGYSLVDRSGNETAFSIPIEIPKSDRICFVINNLGTCESDFEIYPYEVTDWFRCALFGSHFDGLHIKSHHLLEGITPTFSEVESTDNTKFGPKRVYYRYQFATADSPKYIYHMGYTMGCGGDPWFMIMNRNDLEELIKGCNMIYPYKDYLKDRISEFIIHKVMNVGTNVTTLDELYELIIDQLTVALTVESESIINTFKC